MKIIALSILLCLCNVFAQKPSLNGLSFIVRASIGDLALSIVTFKIKFLSDTEYEFVKDGKIIVEQEKGNIKYENDYMKFISESYQIIALESEISKLVTENRQPINKIEEDHLRFIPAKILTNNQYIGSCLIIKSKE